MLKNIGVDYLNNRIRCFPSFINYSMSFILTGSKRGSFTIFSWHAGMRFHSCACVLETLLYFFLFFFCLISNVVFLMQTIAVIPVLPHGVVQLGSYIPVSPFFLSWVKVMLSFPTCYADMNITLHFVNCFSSMLML